MDRHRKKFKLYIPLGVVGLYFYGMFINSMRLGTQSTFGSEPVESIWVWNPIWNLLAIFTPWGLGITAVGALLICLITKKGYNRFSGYKFKRDPRGFDILPDGTHGTAEFMTKQEAKGVLEVGPLKELNGPVVGKIKAKAEDDDKYADYVAIPLARGFNGSQIIYGAPGTGKSWGHVRPYMMGAVKRRESMVCIDPKAELFESMAGYLEDSGYEVRAFNLLDMESSNAWNLMNDIEADPNLVQTIVEVIIKNTSNVSERQDFWEKAEANLLSALIYYVQSLTYPGTKTLLPLEQRSLGAIFRLLSDESFANLEDRFAELPKKHPAKAPYGVFKLANRQIWGNIAIGTAHRLSVFQNDLVDKITSYNEIDLELPGQKPCAYFLIISDQDTSMQFLSSLFISLLFSRLTSYARRHGERGRLPVPVNFILDEGCNVYLPDFKKIINTSRSRAINCLFYTQSVSQMADTYPKKEWEEIVGGADVQIFLGANDKMTVDYFSDKIGAATIRVNNNQMPLMPLFSPIYNSTRPYSQTRSNTQRMLMMPDELLRLDDRKCIVLCRGHKPLELYKISPKEFPDYEKLRGIKTADYIPDWRKAEQERAEKPPAPVEPVPPPASAPPPPRESHPPRTSTPPATVRPASVPFHEKKSARPTFTDGLDAGYMLVDDDSDDEIDSEYIGRS